MSTDTIEPRSTPVWRGRSYEDFTVGDVDQHPLGRTITAAGNAWFTLLTIPRARRPWDATRRDG